MAPERAQQAEGRQESLQAKQAVMEAALQAAQEQATDMAGGQNSELYAELGSVIAAKDALEAELLSLKLGDGESQDLVTELQEALAAAQLTEAELNQQLERLSNDHQLAEQSAHEQNALLAQRQAELTELERPFPVDR